ncbi:YgfZ/GcvT domain-containing protein [Usitatibacter palustris]|uniref:tRNA-modifying protein YgfZ n=1 Tax=Usitatibacter palustris TaxID=2732487 RepID=A0A6M4H7W7_9PROT|nr:folate-binding protein YgfZ [Usitatibacter palustris]QJR14087.1 tRNA-modifying protein YgfZ [Usitatibacter palustris]
MTFVAELSHNALLAISGDDAATFLQGQLTNDVEALRDGTAQWNGYCSPKGRLLATFLLVRHGKRFLAMMPTEIAAPTAKRLGMFVLRSKVKIEDVTASTSRLGLVGPEAATLVAKHWGAAPQPMAVAERDGALCARLDADRFVLLAPNDQAETIRAALEPVAIGDTTTWDRAAIQAGIPIVVAATQDAFVPQMANFELIGGVSFKKGCYTGQEIVARTQYRGILKKRMALVHVDGQDAPQAGDSVYSSAFGEQSSGQIANVAPSPGGGFDALVVAQLEALAKNDLRWKSPDGVAVQLRQLPYPVPGSQ